MPDMSDTARCRQCRYLLHSLPGCICPECGSWFDPLDPSSYDDPQRRHDWLRKHYRAEIRRFIAPPGILSCMILLWLWSWSFQPTVSLAAWYKMDRSLATPIVFTLLVVKLLHIPASWFVHRRLNPVLYPRRPYQDLRRWGAFFLLLITGIAMARPWLPLARFHASRAALESVIAAPPGQPGPRFCRIGLLDIEYIHLQWPWGGVFVQTEHDVNDNRYGFVFSPGGGKSSGEIAPGWRVE